MITAEVGPNAGTVRARKRHLLRNIPSFCFRFTPEIKKQREGWNKEPHRNQKGGEFAKISTNLFQGIGTKTRKELS